MTVSPQVRLRYERRGDELVLQQLWMGTRSLGPGHKEVTREWRDIAIEDETQATSKLDKKFYGKIRKAKDDSLVPDDEYVVFLAKDDAFAAMLLHYLAHCINMDCDKEHIELVREMIDNVETWRRENPEKCKAPDAKGESMLP